MPFAAGAPLTEPEVRRSVNGELRTTLRLQYPYKEVGGHRLYLRTYEGTIPGPTLRVRPGDVLRDADALFGQQGEHPTGAGDGPVHRAHGRLFHLPQGLVDGLQLRRQVGCFGPLRPNSFSAPLSLCRSGL